MLKSRTKPVEVFGDWEVYSGGEILNVKHKIRIQPDRLREPDWCKRFLFNYPWMHENENFSKFMLALFEACELAGIENLNINISRKSKDG